MCKSKMCNWLKSLFGKKSCCEKKGCCEEPKTETPVEVTPAAPSNEPIAEVKEEEKEA